MRSLKVSLIVLLWVTGGPGQAPADTPERQRRRSPIVAVFEQCRDAVVNISTTRIQRVRMLTLWDEIFDFGRPRIREQRVHSVGSGVIIHENGYIVTNAHVVAQTVDITVALADRRETPATIVSVDAEHDLAVLKVSGLGPLPYVRLAHAGDIMVGETVVAIGNPLGLQHTVTAGIVSALNREIRFGNDVTYRGLIQTDAAINPGNSGGPLLNINGELIGINTAIRGDAQNVGFAIPVGHLWALLPNMLNIERRQRVRFGLEVSGPNAEVAAVRPGSPAAEAGLRPGDRIARFNGAPLRDGIDYYVHLLETEPGQTIELGYRRGDETRSARVALELLPPPDGRELAWAAIGLELAPVPETLRRWHGLPEGLGLVVTRLRRAGPGDRAGIVRGDIVLRINRLTLRSLEDLGLALENVPRGQRVLLEGIDARTSREWLAALPTEAGP